MSNHVDKKAEKVAAKRGRKPAATKTDTARSGKKALYFLSSVGRKTAGYMNFMSVIPFFSEML